MKAKCSNERPCQRCHKRGEICRAPVKTTGPIPSVSVTSSTTLSDNAAEKSATLAQPSLDDQGYGAPVLNVRPAGTVTHQFQDGCSTLNSHTGFDSATNPGMIAMPPPSHEGNIATWDAYAPVFDSSLIYNDYAFSIDDVALMGLSQDWSSMVDSDQGRQVQPLEGESLQSSKHDASTDGSVQSRILSAHKIFKKSPWLRDPDPEDSAWTEEAPQLSEAQENRILPRDIAGRSPGGPRLLDLSCTSDKRDALLLLVQQHTGPGVNVCSFPSTNILSLLLRNFVGRQTSSCCPFIHLPTLAAETCRIELLSAMIVSGSTTSAFPEIWKFGLALQERTRLALFKALCMDNTIARHLDILQATILWQEAGSWSGSRRKMEVAESAAGNAPTVRAFIPIVRTLRANI